MLERSPRLTQAFLLLNGVAIIWGSQHTVIKSTLVATDSFPASSLNFWRFLSSAAFFAPSLVKLALSWGQQQSSTGQEQGPGLGNLGDYLGSPGTDGTRSDDAVSPRQRVIRGGLELGVYTFLGFAFQSIGLETTTASRSAFLLYLNVKFVPFLAALLYKRAIPARVWGSAALALTGTWLLSTDQGQGPLNSGDAWCILAALVSALFILRLEGISRDVADAGALTSVSSLLVALLCGLWAAGDVRASGGSARDVILEPFLHNPWPALYLGVVTTAICGWLQVQGQREIPAENAAIIYSMDPLYGAAFSSYFLGERFGPAGLCGGMAILAGVALSAQKDGVSAGKGEDEGLGVGVGVAVGAGIEADAGR